MKRGAALICAALVTMLVGSLALAASLTEHRVIEIRNDYEFTVENGVCSGSGELEDPYIIEGLIIDAGYEDYGIRIHGTSRSFVIRDVEITGAAKSGIYLSYVKNGYIQGCHFEGNWVGATLNFTSFCRLSHCTFSDNTDGIHTYFSSMNQILANDFDGNDTSIWFDASDENEIIRNYVSASHMGLYLNLGSEGNTVVGNAFIDNLHHAYTDNPNVWDDGTAGNYWGGYETLDVDDNGIYDDPYVLTIEGDQDNYPLVNHPRIPPIPEPTCEI